MLSMGRTSLVLLICLLAGSAYSNPPSPAPSKASHKPEANPTQHEEPSAKDQRGTESSPVFIKVLPPLLSEPQPARETESKNDYTSPEWALVYATVVLVGFTAGLMCYTAGLWRETRNLARDAKITAGQQATDMQTSLAIAKQSSDAAKNSAEAAKQMVATTERNARKELRAYMGVSHISIYDEFSGSSSGYAEISITNFGNTMAKATEIWIVAREIIADTDFDAKEERKSKTVVMPNETLGFKESIERATDSSMSNLHPGTILIWGRIEYVDVFEVSHWTTFRFINAKRETFQGPGGIVYGWSTKSYDEGNGADDD